MLADEFGVAVHAHPDDTRWFRTLADHSPAGVYCTDTQGLTTYVNPRWCEIYGNTAAGAQGQGWLDTITAEDRDGVLRAWQQAVSSASPFKMRFRLRHADDSLRHIYSTAEPVRNEQGQLQGFVGTVIDETDCVNAMRRMHESQQRLSLATDSGGIGVWDWNVQTGELFWDACMFRLYDADPQKGVPNRQAWADLLHPDDLAGTLRRLDELLKVGSPPLNTEFRVRWRDGSWHTLRAAAKVTRDAQGRALHVVGVNWDLTEMRRLAEQIAHQLAAELAEQHELLRVTLRSIGDGVITTDAHGCVQWLNPVAERLTGWRCADATGQPVAQVFCLQEQPDEGSGPVLCSRHGQRCGVEHSVAPILAADDRVLGEVLVFHDVTEQRRMAREMQYHATHDTLTGLINRREFERLLTPHLGPRQHPVRRGRYGALLLVDLDQFRLFNDACGHAAGDELLNQVSQLLQRTAPWGSLVSRMDRDEFAVLLEHATLRQAERFGRQICHQIGLLRVVHANTSYRVGASVGLVPLNHSWGSAEQLLQAADAACRAAKDGGRNRVHVWVGSDRVILERRSERHWANRLELALDQGNFELYAQRIDAAQASPGAPTGLRAEVLLRLRQADGSLELPGDFMPAAERYHLATRLDRWVLTQVLRWLRKQPSLQWLDRLNINLSGQSINDNLFQAWVLDQVERVGPEVAQHLCLEITETSAVTNLSAAAAFIDHLRQAGVHASLDDFGAGASSFGYLKQLDVDELKIDGQFIRDLISDPLDEAAVRCFIDVAKVIGISTVAEFVENDATLQRLRAMGISYVQGYLLHQPQPLAQLPAQAELTPACLQG
ncbi:EAL domain-containing protein [Roseateles sp. BYS180W]|uniref:EAL domain-containing protein n=1 Tax=Roseateles rivi TaxID=3299028 RepID=A0ABW7FT64_9BURK